MAGTASVLNITSSTAAECATWVVRVLDPHLEEYSFVARGERIAATHFYCVLVSDTPSEYIQGAVPFDFKNRQKPQDAMNKFECGSVWTVQKPAMDLRAKSEYNGAPIKETLLLAPPTKLHRIATADPRAQLPSRFITPALSLTKILGLRKTRAVDFAAVVESVSASRPVQKKEGGKREVLDVVFLDGSTTQKGHLAECTAGMRGKAGHLFSRGGKARKVSSAIAWRRWSKGRSGSNATGRTLGCSGPARTKCCICPTLLMLPTGHVRA